MRREATLRVRVRWYLVALPSGKKILVPNSLQPKALAAPCDAVPTAACTNGVTLAAASASGHHVALEHLPRHLQAVSSRRLRAGSPSGSVARPANPIPSPVPGNSAAPVPSSQVARRQLARIFVMVAAPPGYRRTISIWASGWPDRIVDVDRSACTTSSAWAKTGWAGAAPTCFATPRLVVG